MTNDTTIQMKMQESKQAHEFKMALLDALKRDPELKYYLGVAVGAGAASIAGIFGQEAQQSGSTTPTLPDWAYLISPGLLASPVALPSWMKWSSGGGDSANNPFDMLSGVIALGGMGFGGFCAMILILKALFGEQGMAEVLKGIGEIVPG